MLVEEPSHTEVVPPIATVGSVLTVTVGAPLRSPPTDEQLSSLRVAIEYVVVEAGVTSTVKKAPLPENGMPPGFSVPL